MAAPRSPGACGRNTGFPLSQPTRRFQLPETRECAYGCDRGPECYRDMSGHTVSARRSICGCEGRSALRANDRDRLPAHHEAFRLLVRLAKKGEVKSSQASFAPVRHFFRFTKHATAKAADIATRKAVTASLRRPTRVRGDGIGEDGDQRRKCGRLVQIVER